MKTIAMLFALMAAGNAVAAENFNSTRAAVYDKFFFPKGRPANYLDVETPTKIAKTRLFKEVLPGVLYRGGGAGGQVPLTGTALTALCEAGFSLAAYGYTDGFKGVQKVQCKDKLSGQPNELTYIAGQASDANYKAQVLGKIGEIIQNPNVGPAFVHCWNGDHASGELAAVSLRQFCGWDGETAFNYWNRNQTGGGPILRIKKFVPLKDLGLTADEKGILCQQTH